MKIKNFHFRIFLIMFSVLFVITGYDYFDLGKYSEYRLFSVWFRAISREIDFEETGIDSLVISEDCKEIPKYDIAKAQHLIEKSEFDKSVLIDFVEKNTSRNKWKKHFSLPIKYSLMTNEEIDSLYQSSYKKGFYESYKEFRNSTGGVKWISSIGFSEAKDEALFFYQTAGSCTGNDCIGMRKIKGKWEIIFSPYTTR